MNAVVYHAPEDIRYDNVPAATCGDAEVRIQVHACAVCGTDLKAYLHGNPRIDAPMVMGHEFTGRVDVVGASVEGFAVGDRIVMATSVACGACFYCDRGWSNLCMDLAPMGFRYPGGMAEYMTVPARALRNGHVVKVPQAVQVEHAALSEPLSCAVNAAENCNIQPGDTVVVVGAGPMGIMNACVARQFGAATVVLAEINDQRLKQAESFGFDRLVNPEREDLVRVVHDQTDGIGADVAIVAAPAATPQEDSLALVRKRGTVCLFASLPAGKSVLSLDSRVVHYNELRVVGTSDSTPRHVQRAVDLISCGSLPCDELVTHVLALHEFSKAFELMESGEALRVVLKP